MEREIAAPSPELGERFNIAVLNRDAAELQQLVMREYPTVLWSAWFGRLSDEDQEWALDNLR